MSFLRRNYPALLCVFVGLAFFVLGLWRGEDETVFRKAVNVCMECIGLG